MVITQSTSAEAWRWPACSPESWRHRPTRPVPGIMTRRTVPASRNRSAGVLYPPLRDQRAASLAAAGLPRITLPLNHLRAQPAVDAGKTPRRALRAARPHDVHPGAFKGGQILMCPSQSRSGNRAEKRQIVLVGGGRSYHGVVRTGRVCGQGFYGRFRYLFVNLYNTKPPALPVVDVCYPVEIGMDSC